jgi:hypothetical protein
MERAIGGSRAGHLYVPPMMGIILALLVLCFGVPGFLFAKGAVIADEKNAEAVATVAGSETAAVIGASTGFGSITERGFTYRGEQYGLVDHEGRTYSCRYEPVSGEVQSCVMVGSVAR